MSRGLLLLVLAICALAYLRAKQPATWHSWMNWAGWIDTSAGNTAADSTEPLSSTLASDNVASDSTALHIISGPLTTGPITVTNADDAAFLTQLNAEDAGIHQMVSAMLDRNGDAGREAWEALEAKIEDYQKNAASNPLTVNNAQVRAAIIGQGKGEISVAHNSPCDFGRHRILVRQLLANPFPEMVALGREEAKPLDLQYTAVDGRVIDLTEMRGKVVLVDFWASWCSYCINEVPSVVAAYNQYHPRGLEIVGISWDDHLNWMLDFMNSQGMRWPQYFYPDHTGNSISRRYNVGTLPTLWLIDKHGCLVNVTCGRDLPAQVERVLAEE